MKASRNRLPQVFWLQTVLGVVSTTLLVLTLLLPNWIERLFGAVPDAGNGSTEWGLTLSLAAIAVVMFVFAGRTWMRYTRLPQSV